MHDLPVSVLMPLPCNQPSKKIRQSLKEASNYLIHVRVFNHILGLITIFIFDYFSVAGTLWLGWFCMLIRTRKCYLTDLTA